MVHVSHDTLLVMLNFGFVFSMLFQKQVCSQPGRPACHRGVIVRCLSSNHRKEHFSLHSEVDSGDSCEPSRSFSCRGRRQKRTGTFTSGHLFTQLYTLESKEPQTNLITTFWWVVIPFPQHQGVISQCFCTCKIDWSKSTWLQILWSDALFGQAAASLRWLWGLRLGLSL